MSGQIDKVQDILLNENIIITSRTDPDYDIAPLPGSISGLPNRIHWRIIKERQISEQNHEYGGRVC